MILETAVASTSPLLDPFPHQDDQEMHYNNKEDDDHHHNDDDDELDGMIMLDDDDHNMLLSPPPLESTVFNDTSPQDADTTTSQNYLPEHSSSPDSDDNNNNIHWRLSNAVHMELQENAKLPTFHWNINRTGSSTTNKFDVSQFFHTTTAIGVTGTNDPRKSRSNSIDCDDLSFAGAAGGDASSVNLEEYLEIGENTGTIGTAPTKLQQQQQHLSSFNLTEIFLTSEMGQRHTNFPTHKSSRFDANAVPTLAATPNLYHNNDLDVDIDPTPLSEIKRKLSSRKSDSSLEKLPKNTTIPQVVTDAPYWPRREQLPIPSPIPPPVDLITVENENKDTLPHDAANSKVQIPESFQSTVPASVSFHTATNPKPTPGTYQTKLIGSWKTQEPQHSSIHSISRPAVEVASQKRTQYGFGRKHVVPSVPATTTTTTTNKSANTKCKSPTGQKKTTKNYSRSSSQRSQSTAATTNSTAAAHAIVRAPSLTSHDDDDSGSGGGGGGSNSNMTGNVAYERKKERAKTARIRLNESIDRLQIALNMAGTQSNQRLAMFQEQTIPYRIISDCIKCSEDAKKWDRPSFVGSAATMIQGLNAQCEALVRALHDERHARAEQTVSTPTNVDAVVVATSTALKNDEDSKGQNDSISMSTGVKHAYCENNFNNSTSIGVTFKEEISTKRLKIDDSVGNYDRKPIGEETEARNSVIIDDSTYAKVRFAVFAEKSILDRIASFLEPISLLRCKRVCRDWKSSGAFANEALWQRLAVDRFGFYNVRQWLAKVEDFAQKEIHSPTSLYKMMDATNIMPHCRLDGMLLLGESRLLGKVSAWTYLVERSNGETMRSVARHSSMPGTGVYTSLPIVQLRTIIQNTGIHDDAVVIREQIITVDASTRRRGDEMVEIDWDDRFKKQILNLDGTAYVPKVPCGRTNQSIYRELCRLRLYEAVVLETNIHARGCATTSKFVQKSNFTKLLIQIRDGTTVPLVIPFPRDASHLLP